MNAGEFAPVPADATQYPWAPEKTIEIWRAFGPTKRKNQPEQILEFIHVAVARKFLFDRSREDVHPAAVNLEIANLRDAASRMESALASLSQQARERLTMSGVEFGKWISSNAREEMPSDDLESARRRKQNLINYIKEQCQPAGQYRPTWNNQKLILDRLALYARELKLDAARSLAANPVNQGTQRKKILALDLACDLFHCWFYIFGKPGSLEPGLEFHKVAAAVAKLFGLTIGSRILKNASNTLRVEEMLRSETGKK